MGQVLRVPVLDHGYLELIETWGSDERIIEAARMSTGKGFLGWGPKYTCPSHGDDAGCHQEGTLCGSWKQGPGDEKLLRYLWENEHATPFEMAGATFEVQAPIFVFREWHRHRIPFGYNEASARYSPLPDLNYVPSVERLMMGSEKNKQAGAVKGADPLRVEAAERFRKALAESYEIDEQLYQHALESGVPKELARLVLPVGRYSKMRATGNLRGWLAFLKPREAPNAQFEIRQYAYELHKMLTGSFPRTMELFNETQAKTR